MANIKEVGKGILKTMFPFVAAAASVGGPLGVMAANMAGKALGIDKVEPTPEGITQALTTAQATDGDALAKMQQMELDFQASVTKMGLDSTDKIYQIDADDRNSARNRQVALKDITPGVLAYVVTTGFFGLLGLLAFHQVPENSVRILDVMVGSLGTAWIGMINFYYGSSAGSVTHAQTVADIATGATITKFPKAA